MNNQLLCFDPSCHKWISLKSCGAVPSPRAGCASTIISNEAWLYGGFNNDEKFHDLLKLGMNDLIWTKIQCKPSLPKLSDESLIQGFRDNKLILHGTMYGERRNITWILDLPSLSCMEYPEMDHYTSGQKGILGLNSSVLIGGYQSHGENYKSTLFIRLEPKSLKQLAMKTIYENKATLPWKMLPNKLLLKIMDTLLEEDI